jgi:hypothetical protein
MLLGFRSSLFKRVVLQPLRRLITLIGLQDKVSKSKRFLRFSLKPFLKKLVGKQFLKKGITMSAE